MKQNCNEPNGYLESIKKGVQTVNSFKGTASGGTGTQEEQMKRLAEEIRTADAIVIGAGAGLSTSAGLTYSGERFDKYFGDFKEIRSLAVQQTLPRICIDGDIADILLKI